MNGARFHEAGDTQGDQPRMRRGRLRRALGVGLTLALLLAACAGEQGATDDDGADDGATPEAEEAPEDVEPEASASYPEQQITWIMPFDPGGGSDVQARRMQPHLEEILGQRIVIEYRPGGGGAVGWAELVRAAPDGYTVGSIVMPHIVLQPLTRDDTGYETQQLRPVYFNGSAPVVLFVPADSPIESLEDFVAAAQENPGGLSVGGSGSRTSSELALTEFSLAADLEVTYVPSDSGSSEVFLQILGGHLDAAMITPGGDFIEHGDEIRVLAVAGDERHALFPDAPTFKEAGYDVTQMLAWGVAVPADTPDEVVAILGAAFDQVMDISEGEALAADGHSPFGAGPDQARQFVDDQTAVLSGLVDLFEAG